MTDEREMSDEQIAEIEKILELPHTDEAKPLFRVLKHLIAALRAERKKLKVETKALEKAAELCWRNPHMEFRRMGNSGPSEWLRYLRGEK